MRVVCALLVDEIRKHPDGRIDLLGIFEDLMVPQIPLTLESLSVFLEVEFTPEDRGKRQEVVLTLRDPAGEPVQPPSHLRFEAPFEEAYPRTTAPLDPVLFKVTLAKAGRYQIEIAVDGQIERTLPVFVTPLD